MKETLFTACLAVLLLQDYQSGMTVPNVTLVDVYDKEKKISAFGQRVFLLLYIDPDRQHIIDPLTKALDSKEFDQMNFEVVSVINTKDTWIPYSLLRNGARREQEKYPDSPILLDKKHILPDSWKLGSCDNMAVVAVIGKDSKIKFIRLLGSEKECSNIVSSVLEILKEQVK